MKFRFETLLFASLLFLEIFTKKVSCLPSIKHEDERSKGILLDWTNLTVYSTNNNSFVPYGATFNNAIMSLSLEVSINGTNSESFFAGRSFLKCLSQLWTRNLNQVQEEKCTLLLKSFQKSYIYNQNSLYLRLQCGTSYSFQVFCRTGFLSNVMNIFVPCPSNGNFEIVFTRESPAATCKPGAVIFCSELNQAGNCWCRNECVKEGNCCPQICASEFCSLGLDISDMCHEMKKNLTIPQTFLSCPAGTGPSDTSCSQHGVCSVTEGVCHCFDGFLPPDCSARNNECFHNCFGDQGICIKGRCKCFKGFTGADCRNKTCPVDDKGRMCGSHGHCNGRTGKCQCEPGWDGLTCTCGHSTNNDKDVFQNSSCPKLENAKYRKNQTLKFTQTIPDWPISVPLPKPVSREQAILYFNQTIDMSLYDFTQEKWKIIAVNLASKLNTSTSRIFLVYFSKLQSIRKSDSSKTCLQTGSCSVDAVTFDSIKNGKTSIGVAVLVQLPDLYIARSIIRMFAAKSVPRSLNTSARLDGDIKIISFPTSEKSPGHSKIAVLSVVGCFILTICSTMSVSAIKNEVRGIKGKRRQWIPVPGAEEDPRAIMLEELILTGTRIDLQETYNHCDRTGAPENTQNLASKVEDSQNSVESTEGVPANTLRRRAFTNQQKKHYKILCHWGCS